RHDAGDRARAPRAGRGHGGRRPRLRAAVRGRHPRQRRALPAVRRAERAARDRDRARGRLRPGGRAVQEGGGARRADPPDPRGREGPPQGRDRAPPRPAPARARRPGGGLAMRRVLGLCALALGPGGGVTASDDVYGEIVRFKKERKVPVVAAFGDVAASGGYYVACAADRIVAHPTTVTGSIGVIMTSLNLEGLLAKVGVRNQTFKAGEHKDILSPLRGATAEERRIVQSILDDLHARFVSVVRESRAGLDLRRLAELTDGRIFDAPQALQAGLIDQIGDLHAAIDAARAAAHVDEARVVAYRRPDETRENIY